MSRNPSPFDGTDSHRTTLLLVPGFLFERGPQDLTTLLLPTHDTFLPYIFTDIRCIGGLFSPVHFQCPRSRLVICYELFKGWLLLSPPSSCLRPWTLFDFHTELALRDLNVGLGCSPFGHQPYARCSHSQYLQRSHIRSSLGYRGFSSPKYPYGALQHELSPLRLSCEIFREEPAISRLDWPFTPIPRSSE